jgi:hypothetical protein
MEAVCINHKLLVEIDEPEFSGMSYICPLCGEIKATDTHIFNPSFELREWLGLLKEAKDYEFNHGKTVRMDEVYAKDMKWTI